MLRPEQLACAFLATAGVSLGGCDARVQLVEPAASTSAPAVLTVVAADTALARRAGWTPGVPGTTVFVRRNEDPVILSFTTDSQGVLSLPDLPAADYWVWAEKHPLAQISRPRPSPPMRSAEAVA